MRPGRRPDGIVDPRLQLAGHAETFIKNLIAKTLEVGLEEIISDVNASDAGQKPTDEWLLFEIGEDDGRELEDYDVRADCTFEIDGTYVLSFWLPDTSQEVEDTLRDMLDQQRVVLQPHGIDYRGIRVTPVDKEALDELLDEISGVSSRDPRLQAAYQAFYEANAGFRNTTASAADQALLGEIPVPDDLERFKMTSDLAFMTFGAGDLERYRLLLAKATEIQALSSQTQKGSPLTALTQALYEAGQTCYDTALELISSATESSKHSWDGAPVSMYSPAMLARGEQTPRREDFIPDTDLERICDIYEVAVRAKQNGQSVAKGIATMTDLPLALLVAAADIADVEGEEATQKELRQRAESEDD